jgi:hypothetical protein
MICPGCKKEIGKNARTMLVPYISVEDRQVKSDPPELEIDRFTGCLRIKRCPIYDAIWHKVCWDIYEENRIKMEPEEGEENGEA